MSRKGRASLSLDLDNLWSYMKTHGDAGWESYPTYLDIVVPRFLRMLKEHDLRITVFVVGQDAALDRNREALAAIPHDGHEIGNHSFRHEPWLHRYSKAEIAEEIARAEAAIEDATGVRPTGFRGPGYSLSEDVLEVLAARGYVYDCSTFPTFIGPLARAYYFMTAKLAAEQKDERKILFGGMRDGLRPLHPYRWRLGERQLLEIPVTTMPLFRVPFHFSYLHWLAGFSERLADAYFRLAMTACRLRGLEPSLLLHPLDFMGGDDVAKLSFFPGMTETAVVKLNRMERWLGMLTAKFEVIPMGEHAQALLASRQPEREPHFAAERSDRAKGPHRRGAAHG
jgi:peptidoglycan/xylan/chitin deacetylase (PgdA/CDA1 family)